MWVGVYNLVFAIPVMIGLAVAVGLTENEMMSRVLLIVGVTGLYFIDYFCAGLTASLIYDQVTTGDASFEQAKKRAFSLGAAFSRSKDLMKQDPTNVGTGMIGVSAMVYVLGIAVFGVKDDQHTWAAPGCSRLRRSSLFGREISQMSPCFRL